ncbi:alpha-D-ribose 1-methylphosphonate 5-triphosphate diphosphatase [Brachybacterium sp. ACRRE]|uniref:alpha-D-ribose 1-methylphosphonate 5-triphosphate diphosphatase n=1 Tax=Brachybacterium sp. ACRRE TaxID=2918184 RepID=UPI001EF2A784|nr:alpha-D-ribose 1-methylphosphonate 5-triphosphate diphosphatase [Brachybacterium sp. ACRRE]MCG7309821.1 alpha-D-ribose 1-methylphosphonate 5-triphosphate diphosphatase [Brachybacterium sp. ACRRE]
MTRETVLTHARIVLPTEVLEGSVLIRDGRIADISAGAAHPDVPAEDLEGDLLMPGVVELHTDHLEHHSEPRPGVTWDPVPAVLSHDAQMAAAGATTVLDAVRIGSEPDDGDRTPAAARRLTAAIAEASAAGFLRADHAIHVRCEVSAADCADVFDTFAEDPAVLLASLMDHTPGQRQYADVDLFKRTYLGKRGIALGEADTYVDRMLEQSAQHADRNRRRIAAVGRAHGIALAAHDDATLEHVAESVDLGVQIAEFPTTLEAARAAREHGLDVVMGAPNIVRGGSQSGNVAASELLTHGLLGILSSDYVPASPLQAVFRLVAEGSLTVVEGARLVSSNPARAVGLEDRGEIAVGRRADLVRVQPRRTPASERDPEGTLIPVVRAVLRQGVRVS